MSEVITRIVIEECAGVHRTNEPVTVGIPFPKGVLQAGDTISLADPESGPIPLQMQVLAEWPDKSLKWVLLDFQTSVRPDTVKEIEICRGKMTQPPNDLPSISIEDTPDFLMVNTGTCVFFVDRKVFKPLGKVVTRGNDSLDGAKSDTVLVDEAGAEYRPFLKRLFVETPGRMRTTIKAEGVFGSSSKKTIANFFARLHFFAGSSVTKIEFTIHNPQAAKHPGGLWDLGDPGSIFFKDLSLHFSLPPSDSPVHISYALNDEPVLPPPPSPWRGPAPHAPSDVISRPAFHRSPLTAHRSPSLVIYQDSSGGENWRSSNHVNRNGEVRTSFRGYRVYSGAEVVESGNRANPIVAISDSERTITACVENFWQNFPKALQTSDHGITVSLFPKQYDDVFELQGGERKTHVFFMHFTCSNEEAAELRWVQDPLVPRALSEWYERSSVFPYLVSEERDPSKELIALIKTAIIGDKTFLRRREIIDEYGWRHFGDLYADHEAVVQNGSQTKNQQPVDTKLLASQPLVSHYNNQYDCIYGMLLQFVRSGDLRWFKLADQLCSHVKDIDIYHTNRDRPEFNHGLFWHTEHYLDARTATHRCFSRLHGSQRDLASYGGGPALSHNYSTGFLYHYTLTGSPSSAEAVFEMASFVQGNVGMEMTIGNKTVRGLRRIRSVLNRRHQSYGFAELDKVYSLNGPGRASGNALNTLIDAYNLSGRTEYMEEAERLIRSCVGPKDNVEGRDLLDTESRWMYTVFLQSLGKYLQTKDERALQDDMWKYARMSLNQYARWMLQNEYPYLDKPEVLEFPNETWAAQDVRKCNVLLYASQFCGDQLSQAYAEKAGFFYGKGLSHLLRFPTSNLTRPIALMMLNGTMYNSRWGTGKAPAPKFAAMQNNVEAAKSNSTRRHNKLIRFSAVRELNYVKWHILPWLLKRQ